MPTARLLMACRGKTRRQYLRPCVRLRFRSEEVSDEGTEALPRPLAALSLCVLQSAPHLYCFKSLVASLVNSPSLCFKQSTEHASIVF